MRRFTLAIAGMGLAVAMPAALTPGQAAAATDKAAVATTYADIAQAMYEDSLATAKELDAAPGFDRDRWPTQAQPIGEAGK